MSFSNLSIHLQCNNSVCVCVLCVYCIENCHIKRGRESDSAIFGVECHLCCCRWHCCYSSVWSLNVCGKWQFDRHFKRTVDIYQWAIKYQVPCLSHYNKQIFEWVICLQSIVLLYSVSVVLSPLYCFPLFFRWISFSCNAIYKVKPNIYIELVYFVFRFFHSFLVSFLCGTKRTIFIE